MPCVPVDIVFTALRFPARVMTGWNEEAAWGSWVGYRYVKHIHFCCSELLWNSYMSGAAKAVWEEFYLVLSLLL